jgi:signal transduction histidine kinase/CheY-like chemotaxis protein
MIIQPFKLHTSSFLGNDTAELAQTKVRLAILVIITSYVFVFGKSFQYAEPLAHWAQVILVYYACYTPFAFLLYWSARTKPGHYPARRLAGMVLDYGSLGFSIIIEPIVMMPLHTVILWITLGNGMRYGPKYLWVANGFALLTTGVVCAAAPASVSSPFMIAMLLLSVIAIPQYASSLLKRIEQAGKEAEAANLAKSQLMAQASHDLRQPLHAIGLYTASLQRSGLSKPQNVIVDRINRSLNGVEQLFRSLLDLSTLDNGAISPKPEPINLGGLLSEITQQNLQQAEWQGTRLRFVDSSKVVFTDRVLLTAMIQNLVSNALKFSTGGSVLLGCRAKGSHVSILILDQGIGIDQAHLPHVFEDFYQIKHKGAPDRQGVGLGLSIVARMAKLLDLEVTVSSSPGLGSCFTITNLEIIMQALPEVHQNKTDALQIYKSPIADLSVLLVEDDADMLAAVQELLTDWGCKITASTTVPKEMKSFDLVITDYDLGHGKTGVDCINLVRQYCGWKVPAIILTGYDGRRIAQEIADQGVIILNKPVRLSELRSAISAAKAKARLKPN